MLPGVAKRGLGSMYRSTLRANVKNIDPGEAGGARRRSALRDAYPLRRTRVSGAESG